jgi:hypothetical protein
MKNIRARCVLYSKSNAYAIAVAAIACLPGMSAFGESLSNNSEVNGNFTVGTTTTKGKLTVNAPQSVNSDLTVLGLQVSSAGGVFFGASSLAENPSYVPSVNYGFYYCAFDTAIQLGSFFVGANGWASISSGYYSKASGGESIAIGYQVEASGYTSVAFGNQSLAGGTASAAFGNLTEASAPNSFAAGDYTLAYGNASFAMGTGVTANALSSAVFGAFNRVDSASTTAWVNSDALFLLGNGTSDSLRSNALMVQKDGIVNLYPFGSTSASIVLNPKGTPSITVGGQKVVTADSSGSLAIGARNPTVPTDRKAIEINAGGYGAPAAYNTASNGDKLILFRDAAASYDGTIGVGSSADMWFKSSGTGGGMFRWYTGSAVTNSMVLDANGRLGIGTTAPSTPLHVFSTTSAEIRAQTSGTTLATAGINLVGGNAGADWWMLTNRGDLTSAASSLAFFKSSGTAGTKMVITDGGNVGIGTTSPSLHLMVGAGTGAETIGINGGTGNAEGGGIAIQQAGATIGSLGNAARLIGGGTSQAFRMQSQNSNNIEIVTVMSNPIIFGTGNAERIRIDASGNLGVGTSSPSAKLEVAGTVKFAKQGDIPMGEFGTNGD